MPSHLITLPDGLAQQGRNFFLCDHMFTFTTGDNWASTVADGGTATVGDAAGGILTIDVVDATDEDEAYVATAHEIFLCAADRAFYGEVRLKFTEASTNKANIGFGFMNAVGANTLVDAGAGPKANHSGATIYKVDGGTTWNVQSSLATAQTTTALTAANSLDKVLHTSTSTAYQRLGIEFQPRTSTTGDWSYYIDGVLVYRQAGFVYTSATEMQMWFGVKNGSTSVESLLVDYAGYTGIAFTL